MAGVRWVYLPFFVDLWLGKLQSLFQTQPCSWREGGIRRKRSLGNETLEEELNDDGEARDGEEDKSQTGEGSFSEELNLFQSIQVLQNDEEELAFRNQTQQSGHY